MTRTLRPILFSCVLISLLSSTSSAQSCSNYEFTNDMVFRACTDLPYLNSFLHWTYDPSSTTVQIAYRHGGITSPKRWVAWAINPESQAMVGSQALVAFQKSDGTMSAYTSPLSSYQTRLEEGGLSFPVWNLSASYLSNEIIIFATLQLPNNSPNVNQVWQEGPLSNDDSPLVHDTDSGPNLQSIATLDLLSGQSGATGLGGGGASSTNKKKNIHGVLNAVSWGILMPVGALIARYLKGFESTKPAWFYLHSTCQTSAYITGVAGWATGLHLGNQSPGIQYTAHRAIGILLFCLATIQVSALLLRLKKEHKFRVYWNIYHHSIGYTIIILGVINIFKGFAILKPGQNWKKAYIGVVVGLAVIAAFLEAYKWIVVVRRKKAAEDDQLTHGTNKHGFK